MKSNSINGINLLVTHRPDDKIVKPAYIMEFFKGAFFVFPRTVLENARWQLFS